MDDDIRQQYEEIEQLKALQAKHRHQLKENRERAMKKKQETKRLVAIGKLVTELLPDTAEMSGKELLDFLRAELPKGSP